jgi:hypothetical protein
VTDHHTFSASVLVGSHIQLSPVLCENEQPVTVRGRSSVGSPRLQGLADTWWRGEDSLIAVYRGEASGFDAPHCLRAHIYGGLDAWGLGGT